MPPWVKPSRTFHDVCAYWLISNDGSSEKAHWAERSSRAAARNKWRVASGAWRDTGQTDANCRAGGMHIEGYILLSGPPCWMTRLRGFKTQAAETTESIWDHQSVTGG